MVRGCPRSRSGRLADFRGIGERSTDAPRASRLAGAVSRDGRCRQRGPDRSGRCLRRRRRPSAVAAGARDSWAYVWPRDAAAVAIALAEAGYKSEAQRVARFLLGLDLNAAARFRGTGAPVPGRDAQGDAGGWVSAAAWAVGLRPDMPAHGSRWQRRGRADYQQSDSGDYLGNAIASTAGGAQTRPYGRESAHFGERDRVGAAFR